jgi:7-cyano-7-deazaguanine synthase
MKSSEKAIVILSGGLDSTILLHHAVKNLGKEVTSISFNYGQRHSRELDLAKFHCNLLKCSHEIISLQLPSSNISNCSLLNSNVDVPHIKNVIGDPQPNTYVPNRNMMFLSIAAAAAEIAGADTVYYGAAEIDTHSGNWDCSTDFLSLMNTILHLNRRNCISIEAPFIQSSKVDIIKLGRDLDVPFDKTHTCYNGEEIACGTCSSCSSRIKGFKDAGIEDLVQYKIPIKWL